MNLEYRIKEFKDNNNLLLVLNELINKINNNKKLSTCSINSNEEETYENDLKYKRFMNYSILRYKTLNKDFYSNINISSYREFIIKNKIISNAVISIKELVEKSKKNNKNIYNKLIMKLIYENMLTIYIIFCFLEHCKEKFEEEKKLFLETFLLLLKESYNTQDTSFIN